MNDYQGGDLWHCWMLAHLKGAALLWLQQEAASPAAPLKEG